MKGDSDSNERAQQGNALRCGPQPLIRLQFHVQFQVFAPETPTPSRATRNFPLKFAGSDMRRPPSGAQWGSLGGIPGIRVLPAGLELTRKNPYSRPDYLARSSGRAAVISRDAGGGGRQRPCGRQLTVTRTRPAIVSSFSGSPRAGVGLDSGPGLASTAPVGAGPCGQQARSGRRRAKEFVILPEIRLPVEKQLPIRVSPSVPPLLHPCAHRPSLHFPLPPSPSPSLSPEATAG